MRCKICGKEINYNADTCIECTNKAYIPYQEQEQRPFVKGGFTKVILIIVGVVVLIGVISTIARNFTPSASSVKPSNTGSIQKESAPAVTKNQEQTVVQTQESVISDSGIINDCTIKILNSEVIEDYEGNPALRVYYEFTNNSDEDKSLNWTASVKAFQHGIELNSVIVLDKVNEDENNRREIKKGVTITCSSVFGLEDTSPIDIEISELISFREKVLIKKTFEMEEHILNESPSSTQESGENQSQASTETSTASTQDQASISGCLIKMLNSEVIEDYKGNPALRVYFEFTNNSSKDKSFIYTVSVKAFQNGIELDRVLSPNVDVIEDKNAIRDIKKGITLVCTEIFALTDNSQVSIEVSELFGQVQINKTYDVN